MYTCTNTYIYTNICKAQGERGRRGGGKGKVRKASKRERKKGRERKRDKCHGKSIFRNPDKHREISEWVSKSLLF